MKYGVFSLALKNIKGRRKKVVINVLLLVLAMLIILLSQTAVDAYKRYIYMTGVEPMAYSCLKVGAENMDECQKALQELFENDDRVSMIDVCYAGGGGKVIDEKITDLFEIDVNLTFNSYFDILERYMDEPIEQLGEYDVVLPRYIFDTEENVDESWEEVPYVDMEQFIGKSITVMLLQETYTFQIVGVYDNVRTQDENKAYIAYDTIKKIYEPQRQEDMENGMEYFAEECYLWIDDLKERDNVEEKVNRYFEKHMQKHNVYFEAHLNEGYLEYIDFLRILGTAIGILVWCWAFFSILLVTIKDVGQRMHEFAVLRAVGYMPWRVYVMLAVELCMMTLLSVIISGLLTVILSVVGNYYIENHMNPFWQILQLWVSVKSCLGVLVLGGLTVGLAWIFAKEKIKKMSVIKELKG